MLPLPEAPDAVDYCDECATNDPFYHEASFLSSAIRLGQVAGNFDLVFIIAFGIWVHELMLFVFVDQCDLGASSQVQQFRFTDAQTGYLICATAALIVLAVVQNVIDSSQHMMETSRNVTESSG